MAKQITRADSALITENLTTTSLLIAQKFGKRHDNILRDIEALEIPEAYHRLNFEEMVHDVEIGSGAIRQAKAYNLTRDGFALLVMGFTGKRAMAWKIKFLSAFNEMEARLKSDNMVDKDGYRDGLIAAMRDLSPEELANWANGIPNKIDRVIDYLDTSLLNDTLSAEARHELDRVLNIARHLRGDKADQKQVMVKTHLRRLPNGGTG